MAGAAADRLTKRIEGLRVVGVCHGFTGESDEALARRVRESSASVPRRGLWKPAPRVWLDHNLEATGSTLGGGRRRVPRLQRGTSQACAALDERDGRGVVLSTAPGAATTLASLCRRQPSVPASGVAGSWTSRLSHRRARPSPTQSPSLSDVPACSWWSWRVELGRPPAR